MSKMSSPVQTTQTATAETVCGARPYHHGDLHRALIEAARTIVERDGAQALSLRAVAREAGVSPAAPYHHFKDKQDLMLAVGHMGFGDLGAALASAIAAAGTDPMDRMSEIGVAYVKFALANPALYRIMYDCARDMETLPLDKADAVLEKEHHAYDMVRDCVVAAGLAKADDPVAIEAATISVWCSAHGVAEMVGFPQFAPVREALGGEEAFIRALLNHVGVTQPG